MKHTPSDNFAQSADHLLAAYDCFVTGDRRMALKHSLMAFQSKDAPLLFRHLQDHEARNWGDKDITAALGEFSDPNDETDSILYDVNTPITDQSADFNEFVNGDGDAPVYGPVGTAERDRDAEAAYLDYLVSNDPDYSANLGDVSAPVSGFTDEELESLSRDAAGPVIESMPSRPALPY